MDNNSKTLFLIGGNPEYVLFKVAIFYAQSGLHVWYISPEPLDKVPDDIKTPDKDVLQQITFVFLKDYFALVSHLNSIHLWQKAPRLIIVTGFEKYTNINQDNYNSQCAALLCTTMLSTISACVAMSSKECFLLVTCEIKDQYIQRINILRDLYFRNIMNHTGNETFNCIVSNFVIK